MSEFGACELWSYQRPYDGNEVLVCRRANSKSRDASARPAAPELSAAYDEYERNGVSSLFKRLQTVRGQWQSVAPKVDWAHVIETGRRGLP